MAIYLGDTLIADGGNGGGGGYEYLGKTMREKEEAGRKYFQIDAEDGYDRYIIVRSREESSPDGQSRISIGRFYIETLYRKPNDNYSYADNSEYAGMVGFYLHAGWECRIKEDSVYTGMIDIYMYKVSLP